MTAVKTPLQEAEEVLFPPRASHLMRGYLADAAPRVAARLETYRAQIAKLEAVIATPAKVSEDGGHYQSPAHGWTCFFCGDTFHYPAAARAHFGATPDAQPGCLTPVAPGEQRYLRQLRWHEGELARAKARIAELEGQNA